MLRIVSSQRRNLCVRLSLKDALVNKDESQLEQYINLSFIKTDEKKIFLNYSIE